MAQETMKIQAIVTPRSGCSYHRIVNPMQYMPWQPGDEHDILWMGPGEANISCDILLYNKYPATPPEAIRAMQANGMKVVVDMDDLWHLPSNHPNYYSWEKQGTSQLIEQHLELADLVTCTSMKLQDKVRSINRNTVVIPNAFPYGQENYIPQRIQRIPHDKVTFLYMGGATHYPDIRLMEGKFRRIASDPYIKNNAEFVLAGYEKGTQKRFLSPQDRDANNGNYIIEQAVWAEYDRMETVFSHTGSYRILPTTNLDEYINYYDQADVALCPLVDTEWNSYKSVLKIAEAGCKGIPVICSKVEPYYPELADCPGILWVDEQHNWLDHIRWCVKNRDKLQYMGQQLSEYCIKNYELTVWNQVRYNSIRALI